LLGAAGYYYGFLFDVKVMRQLFCKSIRGNDRDVVIYDIKMSSDGGTIVLAAEGMLRVLSGAGWKNELDIPHGGKPSSMAMAPDGSWLAVSDFGGRVTIFNSEWERIHLLDVDGWAWKIDLSRDGSTLACMDPQGGLRLWNTANWSLRRQIKASGDCVSLDSSGRYAATTCYWGSTHSHRNPTYARTAPPQHQGQVIAIWDLESGELARELTLPGYWFKVACFSPDGRRIAASARHIKFTDGVNDDALLFDVAEGRLLDTLRGPFDAIEDFVFLPERNAIAFAAYGHTLRPLTMWQLGG
jgi:WD40 repeat protein